MSCPLSADTSETGKAREVKFAEEAEKEPFFSPDVYAAYGMESHCIIQTARGCNERCVVDYEPLKLSTFRVFGVGQGTILGDPVLWADQCCLFVIFFLTAAPVVYYFRHEIDGEVSVRRFIREQEPKMRQFAGILTGLSFFLLAFYTSLIVGRWWTMRTAGIGAIKAATVELELLLNQCVTNDSKVLSAVRRYGRTSMLLIFMWRQKQMPEMKERLVQRELLTEGECDLLLKWNHCLHETIWGWQVAIVEKLYSQGKIKSDQLYACLLQKCMDGRAAVQCCHTHLAVRMPMQYVHLLGILVKGHNVILATIMGLLFGAAAQNGYMILCVQLFLRICILPFLFNAILLINCNLADPFDGSESDFPGEIYQENLERDCNGFVAASSHTPDWLDELQP